MLVVILVVGIVGVVGVGIWKNRGISKEEQVASTAKEKELKKTSSSRTITYEGKEYCYNEHLSNFLLWELIPGRK